VRPLIEILSSSGWKSLMMALLHSLWLGIFWVAVLAAALRNCGNDPERRYRRAFGTLIGLVLSIFVAWACHETDWGGPSASATPGAVISASEMERGVNLPAVIRESAVESNVPAPAINWTGILAFLWLAGLTVMSFRLFAQIVASGQVRRASNALSDGPIFRLLAEIQEQIGYIRLVRVATNALVHVPCVVGIFSPMILIPASMVSGVSAEHLRAVLLHELAHTIRLASRSKARTFTRSSQTRGQVKFTSRLKRMILQTTKGILNLPSSQPASTIFSVAKAR